MAQPQANPFAVPPAGFPPGDPTMQQQQPVQGENPFGGSFAAPTPAQPSDPFSSNAVQSPLSDGSSIASPPQQQAAQQQPFMPVNQGQMQQQQQQPPQQQMAPPQGFPPQTDAASVSQPQQVQQPAFVQQPQQFSVAPPQPPQGMQQSVQGMQQPPQGMQPPVVQQPQGMQAMPPQFAQQQGAAQPQFAQQQQPPQQPPQAPAASFAQQPVDPFSSALVPSAQPANPYAQSVQQPVTQPVNPFGGQAMVPATQQSQSQWAVPGAAPAAGAVNPFDPFAAPPPPAPAPAPPPPSNEIVPAAAAAPQGYQAPDFPFDADQVAPAPTEQQQKAPEAPGSVGPPVNEVNAIHGGHSVVSEPETTLTRRSDDRGGEIVPHRPPQPNLQNRYSQELARNAPPGSAPLPKGELVVKSGYILSRISFRTILMKKWKQSYWVQYGRHTMLWFRSENHFDEWLSNPYLSQAQRNFLVKLAINFVHDLYKPNVRGYQVTQSHTKPYGRKLIRQFKLERWMDYGPTIAAAFGSQDQKEVDELRQTIIDCMRNTPLENGIRATGAVRQDQSHDSHNGNGHGDQRFSYDEHQPPRGQPYEMSNARLDSDGYNRPTEPAGRSVSAPSGAASAPGHAQDLLSDQNVSYDDNASFGGYSSGQYANYSQPPQRPAQSQYAYR